MRDPTRVAVGLSLLIAASAGAATTKLVVGRIAGDAGPLQSQLVRTLCGPLPCIPLSQVSTPTGAMDVNKLAAAEGLLLTGRETTTARSRSVALILEDRPGHVLGRYVFSLGAQGLSAEAMGTVREAVEQQLGAPPKVAKPLQAKPIPPVPGPKPTVPPPPTAVQPSTSAGPGTRASSTPPPPPPPAPGAVGPLPSVVMGPEAATHERGPTPLPVVAVEAGLSVLSLSQDWEDLVTQNLRAYDANAAFLPRVRVEGYPGVPFTQGWARGIGVEVEYERAVGLHSSVGGGPSHPTVYWVFDALAKYRWEPFAFPLRFEPLAGYRLSTFRVEPVNGVYITGLPELEYNGPEVGLAADYPVDRFLVLMRARFLPLLASGEVLSTDFFNSGSLWGIDIEAGAGYELIAHLSVRLVFEYTRYHYSFRTQPGDRFVASGATSRYAGGRLMLRYELD